MLLMFGVLQKTTLAGCYREKFRKILLRQGRFVEGGCRACRVAQGRLSDHQGIVVGVDRVKKKSCRRIVA